MGAVSSAAQSSALSADSNAAANHYARGKLDTSRVLLQPREAPTTDRTRPDRLFAVVAEQYHENVTAEGIPS